MKRGDVARLHAPMTTKAAMMKDVSQARRGRDALASGMCTELSVTILRTQFQWAGHLCRLSLSTYVGPPSSSTPCSSFQEPFVPETQAQWDTRW
ncbi:unnamed protein product [Lampetra fluviatilis]